MVGSSIGMPDIHSGYGFAVGNVAAFDMDDPASIVSPGGVGFDINCGVRLIRTGTKVLSCISNRHNCNVAVTEMQLQVQCKCDWAEHVTAV